MKKMSILTLALIVSLPGCNHKKESSQPVKRSSVEKSMDAQASTVSYLGDEEDDDIDLDDLEEDGDVKDYFDVNFDDEDENATYTPDATIEEIDIEDTDEAFNWIDAQTDDEFKKLYFSFNHYGIRADQKESLQHDIEQVQQLMAEAGSAAQPTVVFEGHACQEGTPAYNLALSEKRAKNVADLFVAAGIDRGAIKVVGRGSECPTVINGKVANGSREDRAPNRRVEIRVIYT
ncbi:MAG TPA: OmpA family protein [Candidatus Babeliales bacterium]|jgi:outer membrane protein OmpA-like peptidoglycan-associated protein|nr:OmpA family protein [Candidatus Babeliales bacterium]